MFETETCIKKASGPPALESVVEPNVAVSLKPPATYKTVPSITTLLPPEPAVPLPAAKAHSMAPELLACITTTSVGPLLVSVVAPKLAVPAKLSVR